MKLKLFSIFILATCTCSAQIPLINETFENGLSEGFSKFVKIDSSRTKVEEIVLGKNKSKALIIDFSDKTKDFPAMLRIPQRGCLDTGKNVYKISFDYKILSLSGVQRNDTDNPFAAIQRTTSEGVVSDDVKYFGRHEGEGGCLTLYSGVPEGGSASIFFLLSPKSTGAKIAIDNFKVEKVLTYPDWYLEKGLFRGMSVSPLDYNFFSQNPKLLKITKKKFFPFIDKFGQFKHKEWKNKIHSVEELKKRADEEKAYLEKIPNIPKRDKYFGYINPNYKFKASGRFRTQKVNGKWFLITPEGNLFWSLGVNTVGLFAATAIEKREHYFEDVSDKSYISISRRVSKLYKKPFKIYKFEHQNLDWKYGKNWENPYGNVADARARKWGLNTFGCWAQNFVVENSNIPFTHTMGTYTVRSIKTKYKLNRAPIADYFSPDFRPRTMARFMATSNMEAMNNPRCVGVFVDNELPWQPRTLMLGYAILQSPANQPAKLKFWEILIKKYKSIKELNAAWGANFKDWGDFLRTDTFRPNTAASKVDLLKIEELYYREYFSACKDAIKMASPDVLYLGCRFAWANPLVQKVASEYVDVVSYNRYHDEVGYLRNPNGSIDKPIIIGEYHFGNQDAGVFGGGIRSARTMKERIKSNNNYIATALRNPNIVGAHWFRWSDQMTSGRGHDGENFSCGMVDICDTPNYEFTESVRKISEQMYDFRLAK